MLKPWKPWNSTTKKGDIIKGEIRALEKSGMMVDIRYKSDGFISNSEFNNFKADDYEVGQEIDVYILKLESKEGFTLLSRKRAEYEVAWGTVINNVKTREPIEVTVFSKVQGGLVSSYRGVKGFIPASQVLRDADQDLDSFLNQTIEVIVLQADRKRRKVIFSHKQASSKQPSSEVNSLFESLEVGQVKAGTVSSIKDFGVFIDLGGIEGLIHISELSWSRVNHPSEVVTVGDSVDVFILGIDRDNRKVSLGMKQLEEDPWVNIAENCKMGDIINGEITRILSFGAFMTIDGKIEGLIHISELSYDHVEKVDDVVKVGDKVQARIIKLVAEDQKIGLSLKGVDAESEDDASE